MRRLWRNAFALAAMTTIAVGGSYDFWPGVLLLVPASIALWYMVDPWVTARKATER